MASYEFFKKEFEFKGKHARMVSELWQANDYEHTYFRRLIDIYMIAPIIGFRVGKNVPEDNAPFDPKSIFPEQMIKAKEDLDYIMQMILILDNKDGMSNEECVKLAFRGAETEEQYQKYQRLFNGYVRGGVEELYDRLIVRKSELDDEVHDNKTANLYELLNRFTN